MKKMLFSFVFLGFWATTVFAEPAAGVSAYTLQTGAFGKEAAADNAASKLEGTGLAPYVATNQRGLFVVRLGNFPSREEAREAAARLKAEGVLESSLIVKTTVPSPAAIPVDSEAPIAPEQSSDVAAQGSPTVEEPTATEEETVPTDGDVLAQLEPKVTVGSRVAGELKDMIRHPLGPQSLGFRAARIALDYLGVKYRRGGMSKEKGMDCSGFVKTVYALCGIDLPRTSSEQYHKGTPVTRGELAAGDLVFFGNNQRVNHVGIYLGEGKYIHAPRPKETIRISSLEEKSTLRRFLGARRLLFDD